jgi:hypothetical protein
MNVIMNFCFGSTLRFYLLTSGSVYNVFDVYRMPKLIPDKRVLHRRNYEIEQLFFFFRVFHIDSFNAEP